MKNELLFANNELIYKYNIYCDESCHLEHDHKKYMIMGALKCETQKRKIICQDIRKIKEKYGIPAFQEVKWTKVSEKNYELYRNLINYFFDNENLKFRAIIIDKEKINHSKFNQNHDTFYYKVYYQLLCRAVVPKQENYIYLDIKDTKSNRKIRKLKECLQYGTYDFNTKYIKNIQTINSKESELLQLCDIIIGAIGYINREENKKEKFSYAKLKLVELIKEKSGYNLKQTTFLSEEKFNLFFMEMQK